MSSTTCNGCGIQWGATHLLKNHRRTERCGGIFLSTEEKSHQAKLSTAREDLNIELRAIRKAVQRR